MMPVTPYTEPKIHPVTAWPQPVEDRLLAFERVVNGLSVMHGRIMGTGASAHTDERIRMLMFEQSLADLRQQMRDLQAAQQAMIEAMLRTDGDENDDADF